MTEQAKKQPLTWHQIDQMALALAGNTAGVRRVCQLYQRYPGLDVGVIERLRYYDFSASSVGQQSSVFGLDYGSVALAAQKGMFRNMPTDSMKREGITARMQRMLLTRIDQGAGMNVFYQTRFKDGDKSNQQLVFGTSDVQTRTEVFASLASVPPHKIAIPDDVTLADVHRFVYAHELQHARNATTYKLDHDFFDPIKKSKLEEKFGCYAKLQPRFEGDNPHARPKNSKSEFSTDLYAGYIDETICDTAAVLHHLKRGGSFSFVKTLADARAAGFVMNVEGPVSRYSYGMHSVLDQIAAKEEAVRKVVEEVPEEHLDQVAVYWVADLGWSRTEFFQQVTAARMASRALVCQSKGEDTEESYQKACADVTTMAIEYSPYKKDHARIAPTTERVQAHLDRATEAVRGLMRETPERPTEHLIELKTMLAYNQARHPEFIGPEGEKHLLAMRRRFAATQSRVSPNEEKVVDALEKRADYLANLELDPRLQPLPEKTKENEYGRA